jgi:hypothetical protein
MFDSRKFGAQSIHNKEKRNVDHEEISKWKPTET